MRNRASIGKTSSTVRRLFGMLLSRTGITGLTASLAADVRLSAGVSMPEGSASAWPLDGKGAVNSAWDEPFSSRSMIVERHPIGVLMHSSWFDRGCGISPVSLLRSWLV